MALSPFLKRGDLFHIGELFCTAGGKNFLQSTPAPLSLFVIASTNAVTTAKAAESSRVFMVGDFMAEVFMRSLFLGGGRASFAEHFQEDEDEDGPAQAAAEEEVYQGVAGGGQEGDQDQGEHKFEKRGEGDGPPPGRRRA